MCLFDQYDALIFDMDGTLIDSGQLHEQAWLQTLNHYRIPIDRPLMRSLAGVPTRGTLKLLIEHFDCAVEASLDEMNAHKEAFVTANAARFAKETSLAELLRQYHGKKPMSVGTGANTAEAESMLRHCQLHALLDHVVGAERVQKPKPAPDTFLLCAELMAVEPGQCVVFEDSQLGLQAARSAGMHAIDVLEVFSIENDYFL
jgi:beta-phosphoglucomutase family hydrolase